jgi:hypothetical protein
LAKTPDQVTAFLDFHYVSERRALKHFRNLGVDPSTFRPAPSIEQLHRDHVLDPDVMVRALGHELVLDLDGGSAGCLAHPNGPMHVHGIAVATGPIEDEGQRRDSPDVEGGLAHLGQVEIGLQRHFEIAGRAAAEIAGCEAGRLRHLGHEGIEDQRRGDGQRTLHPRSE